MKTYEKDWRVRRAGNVGESGCELSKRDSVFKERRKGRRIAEGGCSPFG